MDWLCFIPLAVLCNTALPLAFDPVLIFFASREGPGEAWSLALIGSVCAAFAAFADVKLLGWLHTRSPEKWLAWIPRCQGWRFYLFTLAFAFLPLPFSVVRLA